MTPRPDDIAWAEMIAGLQKRGWIVRVLRDRGPVFQPKDN